MRRDAVVRTIRRILIVSIVVLVCLTGCQTTGKKELAVHGGPIRGHAKDLRQTRHVSERSSAQLDSQMVRIYWAGEETFAVDDTRQMRGRRALMEYLSGQTRERLFHGIVLVAAQSGPGFDPLDVLGAWCCKHNINLYCVALTNPDPAEPAIQEGSATVDWRNELPAMVHWVVQADQAETVQTPPASTVGSTLVVRGPSSE